MSEEVKLPYFDVVLEDKEKANKKLDHSLDMHWGYWEDPKLAYTEERYRYKFAAQELSRLIYNQVDIKEGYKVADVGCGFGGTTDLMNQNFKNVEIVGINIDPRQVEVAKERVVPTNDNKIEFITGDACDLPFEDESIDALIAVECIFHFPDREKFFSEVNRVLKPGGKFAFSDFVPVNEYKGIKAALLNPLRALINRHYGSASQPLSLEEYNQVAARYNFKNICSLDINDNVMPTFKAIYFVINYGSKGIKFFKKLPSYILHSAQKMRVAVYMVIGYQKG